MLLKKSAIAKSVEIKLQELRANEIVIGRHYKEVVDRPVFTNVCNYDDGLSLINSYALGNTAKLIGEMSRNVTSSERQDGGRLGDDE